MRESIGTVSLLNFVIFFIFLVFAFLMGTFSYYKAYRVNNSIVAAIEKYEGVNNLSIDEINIKLRNLGYVADNFNCPTTRGTAKLVNVNGVDTGVTNNNKGYSGYCIYLRSKDMPKDVPNTDWYNSYEVTTIITFQFPVIQDILKLRVSSKTNRIYDFIQSCEEFGNKTCS